MHPQEDVSSSNSNPTQTTMSSDISLEDVEAKASTMLSKKGFPIQKIGEAMAATADDFKSLKGTVNLKLLLVEPSLT